MLALSRSVSRAGRARAAPRLTSTLPCATVSKRHISFNSLSIFLQHIIKSALNDKAAEIKPHVGWLNGGPKSRADFLAQSSNRSTEFEALVHKIKSGDSLDDWPECAEDHVFVFVGGLWSHFYPSSYVKSLAGLLDRGITTERITTHDTRCSVEVNGVVIAEELKRIAEESPSKKLVIMAHSKGSLDALEALRIDPSLAERIDHLIAFQSPFGGSPYAGAYLNSNNLTKTIIDTMIIKWMAGDYSGVKSLTYESRREWFQNNPVEKIPIPVLCCVTNTKAQGLLFEDLASYVRLTFGEADNDGLVVSQDAVLPGSDFVYIEGVSHLASVFNEHINCDLLPSVALEALTYMALRPRKAKREAFKPSPTDDHAQL